MKKHVVVKTRAIGKDIWEIQFLRFNSSIIKVTCRLRRPNRKFWQSKYLWSDWTYAENKITVDVLNDLAADIITEYYSTKLIVQSRIKRFIYK